MHAHMSYICMPSGMMSVSTVAHAQVFQHSAQLHIYVHVYNMYMYMMHSACTTNFACTNIDLQDIIHVYRSVRVIEK